MASQTVAAWLLASILLGCGATTATPPATPKESSATELFQRGRDAAANGDTVRAEQYLSMALDRGFDEKKVLPIMLRVCLSSNRIRAALNHAEPYLRDHPEDQNLRYLVATLHLSLGQVEQARIGLNHVLRVNPKNGNAHYLLGILEATRARESRASEHFHEYLRLEPEGEHAAEVKSRLMDLSVRKDMDDVAAAREEPGALDTIAVHPEVTRSSEAQASSNAAWFGSDAATKTTLERTGVQP